MDQETISSKAHSIGSPALVQPKREGTRTMLRVKELISKTGLSRSTIYSKIDHKSKAYDPLFPKQVKLGSRAVGWFESEVNDWLAACALQREDVSMGSPDEAHNQH